MKIQCQFMNLGEPLFFYGVDYGKKLVPNHPKGHLTIDYDTELEEATITNTKGQFTKITKSWIFSYEPLQEKVEIKNVHQDQRQINIVKAQVGGPAEVFNSAQVETPISKVQNRPKRPPKFQGEESQGE